MSRTFFYTIPAVVEPFSGKAAGFNASGQCFKWSGRATFPRDSSPVWRAVSGPVVTVAGGVKVKYPFSVVISIVQGEVLNRLAASLLGLLAKIKV